MNTQSHVLPCFSLVLITGYCGIILKIVSFPHSVILTPHLNCNHAKWIHFLLMSVFVNL